MMSDQNEQEEPAKAEQPDQERIPKNARMDPDERRRGRQEPGKPTYDQPDAEPEA
jgi:hypothetical protein